MSGQHGFFRSTGELRVEPCNGYCRGNQHAAVVWTNRVGVDQAEDDHELIRAFEWLNPALTVVTIHDAAEAVMPPWLTDHQDAPSLGPRLMVFRGHGA